MMKTAIFLQTILICVLPFNAFAFNNTLSIVWTDTSIVEQTPDIDPQTEGKVIKVNLNRHNEYRIKTVIIDPGHGGHDPGCLGGHSQEKHLALAIAQQLAASLQERFSGIRVIMTRDSDVFVPLHERAKIANRHNADLFISIHCNYMPNSEATHGSETYVMGLHTAEHNLDVAKRENDVILLEDDYERNYDYDPNSPAGHIMLSMFQNAYLEQSILFAEKVEEKIHHEATRRSRGVKQAGFVVLKETTMPSVLIESGFLSNRAEEAYLMTPEGQGTIARAILSAFAEYKNLVEGTEGDPADQPLAAIEMPQQEVTATTASPAGSIRQAPPATPRTVSGALPEAEVKTPFARAATGPAAYNPDDPFHPQTNASSGLAGGTPVTNNFKAALPDKATAPTEGTAGGSDTGAPLSSARPFGTDLSQSSRPLPPPPPSDNVVPAAPAITETGEDAPIQFVVQLAASPQPLDTSTSNWRDLGYRIEVIVEDGLYKYQARHFPDLRSAMDARFSLRAHGFMEAFISAYKGSRRITLEQARAELGE